MEPTVALFIVVDALALLLLPRRWAPLPLIVGACYMTRPAIEVGGATFTVLLLLIAAGIVRLGIRREWIHGGLNSLDVLMIAWGVWMVASVALHGDPETRLVLRVRNLYEAGGLYLLFQCSRSREDIQQIATILVLV